MPIKMMNTDRGSGPIVVCDGCGERIEHAMDANYVWDCRDDRAGTVHDVYFVHKGDCDRVVEARLVSFPDSLCSMELKVMLPYLASNLTLEWGDAEVHAQVLEMFP